MQVELEVGVGVSQRADDLWQDEGRNGRDGTKMERAGQHGAGALDDLDERMGICQQGTGARDGQFPGMGETGPAGLAIGQPDAKEFFKLLDTGRQRWLGNMAGFCCARK